VEAAQLMLSVKDTEGQTFVSEKKELKKYYSKAMLNK
jgi:hypothetical protein